VLDLSAEVPVVLRPGGVPIEALREILGRVDLRTAAEPHAPLPSPGLLDRHYAPHTPLLLFEGARSATLAALIAAARDELEVGRLPVVLAYAEDELAVAGLSCPVFVLGAESDAATVARRLYAALREADALGANLILARSGDDTGVGAAVRDRMRRAAHSVITLP
jgi:L-threonylcarbamoyladenylate synthase